MLKRILNWLLPFNPEKDSFHPYTAEAFGLLAERYADEMDELSPSSEEWCQLAERFIYVTRQERKLKQNNNGQGV